MQTLTRAMRIRGSEGRALPPAFASLARARALLRYGQLALIAGAPGAGKSAFATTYALRTGVPTLYFSADSDRMTLGTRIGASVTGCTTEEVEAALSGPDAERWWQHIEARTGHVGFCWDRGITLDDIDDEVMAYATVQGAYPELVVIDNLKNTYVAAGADADRVRYDQVLDYLHDLGGKTGAAVLILHHVTGQYENGMTPIPLDGLLEKVGKTPRLVLTLYRRPDGLGVSIVKNSNGRMDASGKWGVTIPWDPSRMQFGDLPEGGQ